MQKKKKKSQSYLCHFKSFRKIINEKYIFGEQAFCCASFSTSFIAVNLVGIQQKHVQCTLVHPTKQALQLYVIVVHTIVRFCMCSATSSSSSSWQMANRSKTKRRKKKYDFWVIYEHN